MRQKALFIINPISGGKKKDGVPELIYKHLDAAKFEPVIVFSDGVSHARQMALESVNKFGTIVAVGGDGTVNEVASALKDTETALGIIPFGSGNGLARFLHIPMNTARAISTLGTGKIELIDSGTLNGRSLFQHGRYGFRRAYQARFFLMEKKEGFCLI